MNWERNRFTKVWELRHRDYFCTVSWVYQLVEWTVRDSGFRVVKTGVVQTIRQGKAAVVKVLETVKVSDS